MVPESALVLLPVCQWWAWMSAIRSVVLSAAVWLACSLLLSPLSRNVLKDQFVEALKVPFSRLIALAAHHFIALSWRIDRRS